MLENILLLYLPKLLALIVFIYSLFKLLKNGNHFYTRQLLCSVGVYLFAQIYSDVVKALGSTLSTDFSVKYVGLISSFLFILTAETGVLEKLIDDKNPKLGKYRWIAVYAPVLLSLIIIGVSVVVALRSNRAPILLIGMLVVTYIPAIVGIYYIFKHTIMPTNGVPFLKKVKIIETILFFAYILSPTYYLFMTLGYSLLSKIVSVVVLALFTSALFVTTKEVK